MTSTALRRSLFIVLPLVAGFFVTGFLLPHTVFAQVWTENCLVDGGQCHDISDFWIPVTNREAAYSAMPDCVYSGTVANGASCAGYTGPSTCKVNTVVSNEYIYTDVYTCPNSSGGSSCTMVQTSPGSHTLTGYQWVQQANTAYSGTQLYNWPASANSCLGNCEAYPNSKYCFMQTYEYNYLNDTTWTCTAFSNWSSGANMPQQTTWQNGEPYSRTTDDSYKYEPVYAYTDPTYACASTPTATLTANPISITSGNSSTLTSSCTNATSASIDQGVGSVSTATSTHSVSPSANTTYTLTCTGTGGTATAQATVSVTSAPISGSCSASPTSITAGSSTTWTASASGGTGTYTYSWSGTDSLSGTTKSLAKTYTATGSKTASVTITSGSASKTVNCSTTVTVNATAQPDLTAGGITPTTATAGTPVSLTSQVTNQGNSTTGAGFYTLFQKATDASGTGATDLGTYNRATALAAGSSFNATYSYTFASAGTYYFRACADKSSAGNAGVIAESNENNNCGPWTAVTVSSTPPPSSMTCSVNKTSIPTPPGSVTYTASGGQGSTGYTWTSSDGGGGPYGSSYITARTFNSSANGQYGMSVTDSTGAAAQCPLVTVGNANSCSAPSATISANPARVRSGQTSTITWSASGVNTSCTVSGPGVNKTDPANSCNVGNDSVQTPAITAQSVYTITCDGTKISQAIVNVIPQFQEF